MPILPHQLQSCLALSPPVSPSSSGGQAELVPHSRLPPSFPSTSKPRGMADFVDLEDWELLQQSSEASHHSGDYATEVQLDNVHRANAVTNYPYQPPTTPGLDSYWSHASMGNQTSTIMAPLDVQYLQPHSDVSSTYVTPWGNTSSPIPNPGSASTSTYQYSPANSSQAFGPYSTVQASPDAHRAGSSELVLSPYASSSHISPPPTTPNHAYATPSGEDSSHNLDSYREQHRMFKEALQLPMSYNAGPLVPQKMYIPHTNSDRRRYVEEIELQSPIYFWMQDPKECGISLTDALHSRVRRLQFRDEAVFEGRGPSISVRIQWPGYRPWSRQIPTKDFRSPPQPITKAKLAKNIAKCVERFLAARTGHVLDDDVDPRWKLGARQNEIKLDDLILVSMHHVSMGSWQPHLRLRRPFPS
ncbi:hypothetical protein LshimejAT787_1003200 [Lyophyllum shimeji]|uniref:Uncharacterized protein n=1 Tax=Lyophyllum shimeji TaxID=47721 RepID=A0A9P3PTH9_LYOSH|nr:hypothetical protein LshimejAT787_1003200 [Lyophyllum shimeji]